MKFLTFHHGGAARPGVLSSDGRAVIPLDRFGLPYTDLAAWIAAATDDALAAVRQALPAVDGGIPLEQVTLDAPIPQPARDVICLGVNYAAHAKEGAAFFGRGLADDPDKPVYFSKRVSRAVPPGGQIDSHSDITAQLDYEAELAVVIGREARHVRPEDAHRHVFGYTILNDVTARDLQSAHKQWFFGKSLDGFAPMGPWIVTADEFAYPPALAIQCLVNGELRQSANTAQFTFGIDTVISDLSAGIALAPGTIIATGTPAGVGMGMDPPRFLRPGDRVECRIEGIGSLVNTVL